jgi:hypothetical protein
MEEATFAKTVWFDVDDDVADEEKEDATILRDQLLEDFAWAEVPEEVLKVYLLGALYGTGIAKINVTEVEVAKMKRGLNGQLQKDETKRAQVKLEAIRPDEFIIDPTAKNIDDALFCAHEFIKPLHTVKRKQAIGQYRQGDVGEYKGVEPRSKTDGVTARDQINQRDRVLLSEWYGLVPSHLIPNAKNVKAGMVEAIITIANRTVLLKAVENPFVLQDRPIIAYQHETVPGQFWGRSVSEKGYNSQLGLTAEFRARMDALGLVTHPVFGADITRLPRRTDLRIRPGKVFQTRGVPNDILQRIDMGDISPSTFQTTGDLERWVQASTGAMDSAIPTNISRRGETSGGMAQMAGGALRRSKRPMRNVENRFIQPLIQKALWRYMQFEPEMYPTDYKFVVNGSMGIMAKEFEITQLTQMLGFVEPQSPAFNIILQAIFDLSSSAGKKQLQNAMKQVTAPPSKEQQQKAAEQEQIQMEMAREQLKAAQLENDKTKAEVSLTNEKARHERIEADLEDDLVTIQASNAATAAQKAMTGIGDSRTKRDKNIVDLLKIKEGNKNESTTKSRGK